MRKTIKLFSLLASLVLAAVVSPALAQTAAATPAETAAAAATPAAPTVSVGGMVDAYYSYNFTSPSSFSNGGFYFYNNQAKSFTLGLAEAKFTATQGPASAHVVLAYGQEAALGIGTSTSTVIAPGPTTITFANGVVPGISVLQAYASYNAGQWTFNAGRFVTWMGNEVIESSGNWNYSHSLLFGAIPFWHTGLSVNFAPSTVVGFTAYDVDGPWQSTAGSQPGNDYGLQVAITPNSMWTITLNGIMSPIGNGSQNNMTAEGIVVYKPNSTWSFALDAQYGMNSVAAGTAPNYFGLALYGKYQIQSDWDAALRLELVSDNTNNFGFYGQALGNQAFTANEGTLTLEHDFATNLLMRLEGRLDMANYNSAAANIFPTDTSPTSSNLTGTASLVMTY